VLGDRWHIPKEHSKNHRAHWVALSRQALALLRGQDQSRELIFGPTMKPSASRRCSGGPTSWIAFSANHYRSTKRQKPLQSGQAPQGAGPAGLQVGRTHERAKG
jgi:integrase